MIKTLGDLLKKFNIESEMPISHIPIWLFTKEQYCDLIAIVCLYAEGLILSNEVQQLPEEPLDEESINAFYEAVKDKVFRVFFSENKVDYNNEGSFTITNIPRPKIKTGQMICYLKDNPVFNILRECLDCSYKGIISLNELKKFILKYPITLSHLYNRAEITVPKILSPALQLLLKQDLHLIEGLTPEQWPTLMFYAALFIFRHAEISNPLLELIASGREVPSSLKTLYSDDIHPLKVLKDAYVRYIQIFDLNEGAKTTPFGTFASSLADEFSLKSFNPHPLLLALNCFEQCPPLKELLVNIYTRLVPVRVFCPNIVLNKSPNRFILSEIIGTLSDAQPIVVHYQDFKILEKLINNANTVKSASVLPEILKPDELSGLRRNISFFENVTQTLHQLKSYIKNEHHLENNELNRLLSSGINELPAIYTIDYEKMKRFVIKYGINSKSRCSPTTQALKELFLVISDKKETLEMVIHELQASGHFIDLNMDFQSLNFQLRLLEESITKLGNILQCVSQRPGEEEFNLRIEWLDIQMTVYTRFKKTLLETIESREEEQMRSGFNYHN